MAEKRLAKQPGGRKHELKVRLTDEQRAKVSRRADASGVSISRLLVEAALAGSARTATERRAIVIELLGTRRLVAAMGNNLNQLARIAHATGEVPDQLPATLEAVERVLDRLERAASELAPS
ncbi:plasmid mobilization protein [Actinomadura rayongensis]|uniref:Plasmid mobilization relaxosome protein MobC n=1 Tax=Actinomadura rayongensis TaxID=1429076 RepID=A0A6I4WBH9_9ACTN|nr:plasmid mobilization relaxosome protein MobC [Actinomadura rayongensis]